MQLGRLHRVSALLFGAYLGMTAGCSSGSKKVDRTPNPYATQEGFCHEWAVAACNSKVVEACDAETEGCIESQQDFCEARVPASSYVATNALDCIDAVRAAYSDAVLTGEELALVERLEGDCSQLFKGSAAEGATCARDSDCDTVDGYACVIKSGDLGECHRPVVQSGGFPCAEPNELCAEGFFCDGNNCILGGGAGDSCDRDADCQAGFLCQEDICVPKAPRGGSCTSDGACMSGVCAFGPGSSTGQCVDEIPLTTIESTCDNLQ